MSQDRAEAPSRRCPRRGGSQPARPLRAAKRCVAGYPGDVASERNGSAMPACRPGDWPPMLTGCPDVAFDNGQRPDRADGHDLRWRWDGSALSRRWTYTSRSPTHTESSMIAIAASTPPMSIVAVTWLVWRSIRVTVPSAAATQTESGSRPRALGRAASGIGDLSVTPVTGSRSSTAAPSSLATRVRLHRSARATGLAATAVGLQARRSGHRWRALPSEHRGDTVLSVALATQSPSPLAAIAVGPLPTSMVSTTRPVATLIRDTRRSPRLVTDRALHSDPARGVNRDHVDR